jgi:hypothetical protein
MRLIARLPHRLRWPIEDLVYLPFSRRVERPRVDIDFVGELRARFRPDLGRLAAITGETFDEWTGDDDGANHGPRMY